MDIYTTSDFFYPNYKFFCEKSVISCKKGGGGGFGILKISVFLKIGKSQQKGVCFLEVKNTDGSH